LTGSFIDAKGFEIMNIFSQARFIFRKIYFDNGPFSTSHLVLLTPYLLEK